MITTKKTLIFLLTVLIISLIIFYYLSNKNKFEVSRLDLITNEKILDRSFNISKSISDFIKRDNLSLVNENNTIIITWQMYLPNIGGEFYWTSNYNKDKSIIRIGESPHILYNAKENKIKILTKYQYSPFKNHYPIIELEDINLQSWNTYTVYLQNYNVRIYVNGELVLSQKLDNGIIIDDYKNSNLLIGELNNNLFGKIRNLSIYLNDLSNEKLTELNL
jgi:hypothetical protein